MAPYAYAAKKFAHIRNGLRMTQKQRTLSFPRCSLEQVGIGWEQRVSTPRTPKESTSAEPMTAAAQSLDSSRAQESFTFSLPADIFCYARARVDIS